MKNLPVLLLFLAFSALSAGQMPAGTNIRAYRIRMTLDTGLRRIAICSQVDVAKGDGSRNTSLILAHDITMDSARMNGRDLPFCRNGDTLCLLTGLLTNSRLTFWYSISTDSFMYDKAIVLTRGMKWCPYLHDNISTLHSEVTVPEGYRVYSSGTPGRRRPGKTNCTYKFSSRVNSGLPFIIAPAGYYTEKSGHQDGFSIKYCFLNKDSSLQRSIMTESLSALKFCNEYIGRYKQRQLTYIEVPGFGSAQSLETFILMSSEFIRYFNLYKDMKSWVAHETIHQWIGTGYFNAIYSSPRYGTFIEESLTEYMRYVYIEKCYGLDSLAGQIKHLVNIYNNEIKGTDQDLPASGNQPGRVFYCTAPLIFHLVRQDIGDLKWQRFIRKLYSGYYGRGIDYEIFKKTLSLYATPDVITRMEENINRKGIPGGIICR